MTYCAARSVCSSRSCSPYPWRALRIGIRAKVHPMNAYIMLSMGCTYTGAFAPFYSLFYLSPSGTRVKRAQLSNVASGHAPIIKILAIVRATCINVHGCLYLCYCVDTEKYVSDFYFELTEVIKTMFPLHVVDASCCKYFV